MGSERSRILLVEDNPGDARLLHEALVEAGSAEFELVHVWRLSEALERLENERFDAILLDLSLPDGQGLDVVARLGREAIGIPFVVLTGLDDEEMALKAVREGAQDYLVKGQVHGTLLARALRYAIERKRAERRITALRDINLAITSTLELRKVLDLLLEKIDLLMSYSAAAVWLAKRNKDELEIVASRNLAREGWRSFVRQGRRGLSRLVFDAKTIIIINNFQSDLRVEYPEFFRKHGLVSYLGVPLILSGKVLGVLSFYSTEERQPTHEEVHFLSTLAGQAAIAIHNSQLHEQARHQAKALEKANKVKDEFLGFISHELKTPVQAISGYAELILDGALGETNTEQETFLAKIMSRANDLFNMINSILVATKVEAGAISVENEEIHLGDFLDQLKSAYDFPLAKELAITWDYSPDLPVVITDGEKLRHILANLISNAIKFTPEGSVVISARQRQGSGLAEFKVADTGIGIPKESLPSIFEKFRQVESSQPYVPGSVGLGLYIVKSFTELLGGKIDVESEPGKGTIFTVRIPCPAQVSARPDHVFN